MEGAECGTGGEPGSQEFSQDRRRWNMFVCWCKWFLQGQGEPRDLERTLVQEQEGLSF